MKISTHGGRNERVCPRIKHGHGDIDWTHHHFTHTLDALHLSSHLQCNIYRIHLWIIITLFSYQVFKRSFFALHRQMGDQLFSPSQNPFWSSLIPSYRVLFLFLEEKWIIEAYKHTGNLPSVPLYKSGCVIYFLYWYIQSIWVHVCVIYCLDYYICK